MSRLIRAGTHSGEVVYARRNRVPPPVSPSRKGMVSRGKPLAAVQSARC
nr:hypothetical protein [Nonomuraea diastatica]